MPGLEFGVRDGSEYDTEDAECLDNGEFAVTAGEFVEDITPSPLPVQKPAAGGCQSSDTVVARSLGELGVTLGLLYRVSSKTVPTWVFALLSASTHKNCKGWDVFEKFRKFAT